jgi:hypothetical protein
MVKHLDISPKKLYKHSMVISHQEKTIKITMICGQREEGLQAGGWEAAGWGLVWAGRTAAGAVCMPQALPSGHSEQLTQTWVHHRHGTHPAAAPLSPAQRNHKNPTTLLCQPALVYFIFTIIYCT